MEKQEESAAVKVLSGPAQCTQGSLEATGPRCQLNPFYKEEEEAASCWFDQ